MNITGNWHIDVALIADGVIRASTASA